MKPTDTARFLICYVESLDGGEYGPWRAWFTDAPLDLKGGFRVVCDGWHKYHRYCNSSAPLPYHPHGSRAGLTSYGLHFVEFDGDFSTPGNDHSADTINERRSAPWLRANQDGYALLPHKATLGEFAAFVARNGGTFSREGPYADYAASLD